MKTLNQVIKDYCEDVIIACGGDYTYASKSLGIGRATLYRYVPKVIETTSKHDPHGAPCMLCKKPTSHKSGHCIACRRSK